ncbi:hypothetical protein MRB53_037723 [Persea americana]|nr:hypothetical protein MRB53_037723 [Persea americana]
MYSTVSTATNHIENIVFMKIPSAARLPCFIILCGKRRMRMSGMPPVDFGNLDSDENIPFTHRAMIAAGPWCARPGHEGTLLKELIRLLILYGLQSSQGIDIEGESQETSTYWKPGQDLMSFAVNLPLLRQWCGGLWWICDRARQYRKPRRVRAHGETTRRPRHSRVQWHARASVAGSNILRRSRCDSHYQKRARGLAGRHPFDTLAVYTLA